MASRISAQVKTAARKLRRLAKTTLGWSVREFAKHARQPEQTFYNYLKGKNAKPEVLDLWADAVDARILLLVKGPDEPDGGLDVEHRETVTIAGRNNRPWSVYPLRTSSTTVFSSISSLGCVATAW